MSNKRFLINKNEVPIVVPKKIMIFAGHPDDELISCGGTILKYHELGSKIIIAIATKGLGGYAKEDQKELILNQRIKELEQIKIKLQCEIIELDYSDLKIEQRKVAQITNLIRENQPHVILLPHYTDFHRVHRNLSPKNFISVKVIIILYYYIR
jgi:LmbE family N-acetylglucosaminyl deacetylase